MIETLQYPRHLHRGGTYRIVADAVEAAQAMTEGWTLSPEPLPAPLPAEESAPPASQDATSEHAPAEAPVALRRKPGRPRKSQE